MTDPCTDSEKPQKLWSLYILRCADSSLYCGITNNVTRRFREHQSMSKKTAKYLRGRGPLEMVFQYEVGTHSEALKIEMHIKSLKKSEKEQLVTTQNLALFI